MDRAEIHRLEEKTGIPHMSRHDVGSILLTELFWPLILHPAAPQACSQRLSAVRLELYAFPGNVIRTGANAAPLTR